MDYNTLLELAADLGYRLAMSGAETFRVEESVTLVLKAYGIESEVFAIPNCMIVSIETPEGKPMTRMRRIGYHGNDLDSVERYSNLSRRLCAEHPDPQIAVQWLKDTDASRIKYGPVAFLLSSFIGTAGFSLFYGGTFIDALCGGICGILIGIIGLLMDRLHANPFFKTIISAFVMAMAAYAMGAFGIASHPDAVTIGALMILVPGLIFTNAMRDIIYGDTNSGVNRIVQVLLIAVAIAMGTGAAWSIADHLWGMAENIPTLEHGFWILQLGCLVGCIGFALQFNIHGPGVLLCALGGCLGWGAYWLTMELGGSDLAGYFWAAVVSAAYSEIMARIRRCPAISYLVVSIFPLIPGAGVYYTMNYAVRGDMASFADTGTHAIAIAGFIAVGILMVSTTYRLWGFWKASKRNT